ncbi:hypothetical protein BH23ACT5_BH23ACT5_08460 [soil metagenome]
MNAEPLGIRTGFTPGVNILLGGGAALAAPWPMIVAMGVWVRRAADDDPGGGRAKRRLALLATLFLAGSVAEPVSHRILSHHLPASTRVIAALNIVLPIAMLVSTLAAMGEKPAGGGTGTVTVA